MTFFLLDKSQALKKVCSEKLAHDVMELVQDRLSLYEQGKAD